MGDSFPSHFTNEHEILFYEGISNDSYQSKNRKDKSSLMMKNQEILKENISSPEFSLFHMASPDLERLIVESNTETSTTNSRETTTINTSHLNVLNLVSPDFEKIFPNFHEKDCGEDKGTSVQKQHEVYTKTFVDALHKIQGQQQPGNKHGEHVNNIVTSDTRQQQNNFEYQKHQFVKRKGRTEQFMRGHDRRDNTMNKYYDSFGSFEDKNKNKIGTIEQHSFGSKAENIGENGNTMRAFYDHQLSLSDHYNTGVHPHMEVNSNRTNLGNQSNPDSLVLTMGEGSRNTIQARYSNNRNIDESNPNIYPGTSDINHPELFKLHAHVTLSENVEQLPPGHQDVHTGPQVFSLPPIDLQVQEIVKRERKKQKNRVAASKCRKKKLQREAQLEVRVQQLRERNIELTTIAGALKNQLNDLKQHVMEHIACGCHVTAY